jgi:hypothetical protein
MNTFIESFSIVCATILISVIAGVILSYPVMLLWNDSLVPAVPGVKEISWLQAWGILILCNLLFKGTSTTQSK